MKRALRRLAVVLIVAFLAFEGAVLAVGPWLVEGMIVHAPNAGRAIDARDDTPARGLASLGVARQLRIPVAGPPAASLLAWVVEPQGSPGKPARAPHATVLVLHGIRSHKGDLLDDARELAAGGFRAVLPDLRGHGRSSGDFLTYGVLEAADLSQAIDALEREGLAGGPIGAYGVSYGGACAIQLAGRDPRVSAVVSVAGFASLREVLPDYARLMLGPLEALIPGVIVDRGLARAGRAGGFDPALATPLEAIARTKARVLLIHGTADRNIPPRHAEALHAAAAGRAEVALLDGRDHVSICAADAGAARTARAWFAERLTGGPAR